MASSFELPPQVAELLGHQTAEACIDAASGYCWAFHRAELLLWRFQDGARPPVQRSCLCLCLRNLLPGMQHLSRPQLSVCRSQGSCVQPRPGIRFSRAASRRSHKVRGAMLFTSPVRSALVDCSRVCTLILLYFEKQFKPWSFTDAAIQCRLHQLLALSLTSLLKRRALQPP